MCGLGLVRCRWEHTACEFCLCASLFFIVSVSCERSFLCHAKCTRCEYFCHLQRLHHLDILCPFLCIISPWSFHAYRFPPHFSGIVISMQYRGISTRWLSRPLPAPDGVDLELAGAAREEKGAVSYVKLVFLACIWLSK